MLSGILVTAQTYRSRRHNILLQQPLSMNFRTVTRTQQLILDTFWTRGRRKQ